MFEKGQLGQCVIMPLCREWYGYHFPELVKIINDNATYCRLAQFIGNRRELNEEKLEKLEELTMDGAKAKAILDASRSSMGQCRTWQLHKVWNFEYLVLLFTLRVS